MDHRGAVSLAPAVARRPLIGPQREHDLGRVAHPEHLRLGARRLVLIDDPFVARLADGDPTMGWEGDARLALYVDSAAGEWLLVRLETDGTYRISAVTDMGATGLSGVDLVGHLVSFLVTHDGHRGYDPLAEIDANNAAVEAAADAQLEDWVSGEGADLLAHALRADLGAHL